MPIGADEDTVDAHDEAMAEIASRKAASTTLYDVDQERPGQLSTKSCWTTTCWTTTCWTTRVDEDEERKKTQAMTCSMTAGTVRTASQAAECPERPMLSATGTQTQTLSFGRVCRAPAPPGLDNVVAARQGDLMAMRPVHCRAFQYPVPSLAKDVRPTARDLMALA